MSIHTMPFRMQFDEDAEKAVYEVFKYYREKHCDFGSKGFFEKQYTESFVRFMGTQGFAEVVCSGTAAIFVALQALHLPSNSEVLVSAITDPGMISPIILLGHKIRLVDNAIGSLHPDLSSIQSRVTRDTKCIILNHYSGKPIPEIKEICSWAKDNQIKVIEDCSQAHGASVANKLVGTFGDVACFSTMYSKAHSTGGQGGVCFTQDPLVFNQLRMSSSKGKPFHDPRFNEKDAGSFQFPALNLNLNEISCAIGNSTLSKVMSVNEKRKNFLTNLATQMKALKVQTRLSEVNDSDAPFFAILKMPETLISKKIEFAENIKKSGISINSNYLYVVDEWNWVQPHLADGFKTNNARKLRDSTFHLLFNENFTNQEARIISEEILKTESQYGL